MAYHSNGTPGQRRPQNMNNTKPMNNMRPMNNMKPMNNMNTKQPSYGQRVPNMQTQPVQPMQQMPPTQQMQQTITSGMMPAPDSLRNPYYTAGFLRQYIGSNMRVEYLLGTSGPLVDRIGTLVDVGANYIVLQPYLSDDLLMTDLYSIRFVTIYDQ